jgi:predicted Zn-dependent protease
VIWLLAVVGCQRQAEIYPPAPFERVASGFPEIIALSEEPSANDQPAYDEYWQRRREVHEHSMNQTIMVGASQMERDLFQALYDSNYAVARKLADEILSDDADSLVGLYGMANVEFYAENDLPYALNSIRRARQKAEGMGRLNPRDPLGQEWYLYILSTEWQIVNALNRMPELLTVTDRIEQIYFPVPWIRSLALIKLGRLDEASREIDKYQDRGQFLLDADNARIALEDRRQSRESALAVAREVSQRHPDRRVLQYNLGLSELNNAQFDEAEQAFLAAAKATDNSCPTTPYVPLALLMLQQGRFPEALDALKQGQVDRSTREVYTLSEDEASMNLTIGLVLLAYNEAKLAQRFLLQALQDPYRGAFSYGSIRDIKLSTEVELWMIRKYAAEELHELISFGGTPTISGWTSWSTLQTAMWATQQRFTNQLGHAQVVNLVSPYNPGGASVQSWQLFSLLDMVPLGILEVALAESARGETASWIAPYYDSLEAGIRLRKNDPTAALRLASRALERLPPQGEKVFRSFVSSIAGQAAWQLGQPEKGIGFWTTTLRDFPQALRWLEIQIPILLINQAGEVGERVTLSLAASRRFFVDPRGCEINVRKLDDERLLIEMFRNDRSRHLELVVPIVDEEGFAATTVAQFHQKFFQPLVELTQTDLGSLDGSPVAARMRRQVDQLFSDFIATE